MIDDTYVKETTTVDTNKTLAQTFLWMFLGLLSTGIVAAFTYYSGAFIEVASAWTGILIAQVVIAIVFGLCFRKLPASVVTLLFFAYSMLTGATFSVIFVAFELETIAIALLATAGFFGILAFVGYKTQKDLSKFGTTLFAVLITGLVLTLLNLFIGSEPLDIALDWIILVVFAGLTIYDMNKIKEMSQNYEIDQEKVAIYGAMELYLDFINMFLRILEIFGSRRD